MYYRGKVCVVIHMTGKEFSFFRRFLCIIGIGMAIGYIGHEKNYVYIDGSPLFDVQSVDSSLSTNRTPIFIAGVGAVTNVSEGVLSATMNLTRYVISDDNDDVFASLTPYEDGFSVAWEHIDSAGENNFFAMDTAYVNSYTVTAAVNSVPSTSMELVGYGPDIGEIDPAPSMPIPDPADFLTPYVYPKDLTLTTDVVNPLSGIITTNRVQSFEMSFNMNRKVKERIGQMLQTPETYIDYPFQATLSLTIDVDEYSIPAIDALICEAPQNIFLQMKTCEGTLIRTFQFSSGVLQSASMSETVRELNTATLEYSRNVNSNLDLNFWSPA